MSKLHLFIGATISITLFVTLFGLIALGIGWLVGLTLGAYGHTARLALLFLAGVLGVTAGLFYQHEYRQTLEDYSEDFKARHGQN